MLPEIIGVVGPIRAGKTTASAYLTEHFGYKTASNSELLKQIAVGLEIIPDRTNLKRLGDAIFNVLGNETLARYRVSKKDDFPIVVDGIRYPEEIKVYSQIPSFKLLAITAQDDNRYDRAMALAHRDKDSYISPEAFRSLSEARSEASLPSLFAVAHCLIVNDKDIEDLKTSIDSIMEQWTQHI